MAALPRIAAVVWAALVATGAEGAPPTVTWDPISPAELSGSAEPLDPDAPAEAIFRKITIDDSNYPPERKIREYVRYRIFDPEKATGITRISQMVGTVNGQSQGNPEIHARLTLRDGTSREFGNESIHVRPLLHTGADPSWLQRLVGTESVELEERFLAVSGIETGSILEFQVSHSETIAPNALPATVNAALQLPDIPIRQEEFAHRVVLNPEIGSVPFVLNAVGTHAQVHQDEKAHVVTVTARDLPGLAHEPLSVATADYALTYLCAYRPHHLQVLTHHNIGDDVKIDPNKTGPWSSYATRIYFSEADSAYPTSRVKKLANELTAAKPTALDKARALHRFVVELHLHYLAQPRTPSRQGLSRMQTLDQVLDCEKHPEIFYYPTDFVWLAVALYRAAGFEAHTVMLPNRRLSLFDERQIADMFLPVLGVRVLVGSDWEVSYPESLSRLPFGLLPWECEGQVGLVAQSNKQEFFAVPLTPSDRSLTLNAGNFHLAADGTLTGTCRRVYTGQNALIMRDHFRQADPQREHDILARLLSAEFKSAKIRVTHLNGADNADVPLDVGFEMTYPDFATMTKNRIIFRPSVFHASFESPFVSENRRYAVEFPFGWTERDEVTLHLPEGYLVESPPPPVSAPGKALSYACISSYSQKTNTLRLQRDFTSGLLVLPVSAYGNLKGWYDRMADCDRREWVLVKAPDGPAAPTVAPAAVVPPPSS